MLIALALAVPRAAVVGYLAIALILIIPIGVRKEPSNGHHDNDLRDLDAAP